MSEEDVKLRRITPAITAKWNVEQITMETQITDGKINLKGNFVFREKPKRADYILYINANNPIAVVEAKDNNHTASYGLQQAMTYARMLDVPFAYSSNGEAFYEHDFLTGRERELAMDEFPSPDELIARYEAAKGITDNEKRILNQPYYTSQTTHAPRYYQRIAVNRTVEAIARGRQRILLVMATGTGKTYTAFQIVYRLLKSGLKKKVLYLADRNILVDQSIQQDFAPLEKTIHKINFAKDDPVTITSYEVFFSLYQQLTDREDDGEDEDGEDETVGRLAALYSTVRPYLHNMCIIDRQFSCRPIASTGFAVMSCYEGVFNKYLFFYFMSPAFDSYANHTDNAKGVAYPAINDERLYRAVVPLPPLAEQKRIVAKLEELLTYVDRYEKAWRKLEELNKRFPDDLQKSILQTAIQGKLVEQRPEEGTGEELYRRIQAEKRRLIKEGKIKKEKPLPEITEDEIPFDIPEIWKWVRVGSITILNPKNDLDDNLDAAFIPMSCVADGFRNQHTFEVKKWKEIKKGFTHFADGDIGIAKITPCFQNRKSVMFQELESGYGAGTTELSIVRVIGNTLVRKYLLWFFKTDYFITNGVKSFAGTAGQQRIHKDYLANCLVPLPPLAEQKRIVAKLEELLPLCGKLKNNNMH